MLGRWKNDELPTTLRTTARNRTEAMLREFGHGDTTLNTLTQSCYIQGITDTFAMLMDRFPRQVDKMFSESPDNLFSEYYG